MAQYYYLFHKNSDVHNCYVPGTVLDPEACKTFEKGPCLMELTSGAGAGQQYQELPRQVKCSEGTRGCCEGEVLWPRSASWSGRKEPYCPNALSLGRPNSRPAFYSHAVRIHLPLSWVCLLINPGGLGLPLGQRSANFFLKG